MAFTTILVAPGLPRAAHRRAVAASPSASVTPDLEQLTSRAGFSDVRVTDVTADYLVTAGAWLAARERHRDELRPVAPVDYDERVSRGRAATAAVADGLLRRSLVVATRP